MVVIAQKIVSKAEGRTVDLADVVPSEQAIALAAEVGKDPRIVEVVLSESVKVVRSRPNLMIMQHRLGFVMANAGVDQSNVAEADGHHRALLLPLDPDGSAEAIRAAWPRRPMSAWSSATVSAGPGAAAPPAWRSVRPASHR